MDHADEEDDSEIFIYRGGRAPQHVTHILIDKSIDDIEDEAFDGCKNLLTVETHDGLRKIGKYAFYGCESLRRINLKSVIEIGAWAFSWCENVESVEFGDRLETIGECAFRRCFSLKHLKLPSIVTIGGGAFYECRCLRDAELSERLETIGEGAFRKCRRLKRIAVPLKRDLFGFDDLQRPYSQLIDCEMLITVDLVGGIHETVASLHMESWRTEMNTEINRINQVLPDTYASENTEEIRRWMDSVIDKMDHYKAEHYRYVKEGITLLELALWKSKLGEKEDICEEGETKKAKVDAQSARKGKRITCGADVVIKNVLPFLQLK